MTRSVTLARCPIGLFRAESGELCLKTEYGSNEGRINAYIVLTGEMFWGSAPQTIASQRTQLVTPVEEVALAAAPPSPEPVAGDLVSREAAIRLAEAQQAEDITMVRCSLSARSIADALRALPAASQWRDMAEAPRDNTEILVFCTDIGEQFVAYWGSDYWIYAHGSRGEIVCIPTHWMPLPPAPISVEKGLKG